jgi:hypothetical protein
MTRGDLRDRASVRNCTVVLLGLVGIAVTALEAGGTASTHIWAPSTDVQRFNSLHVTSDLYLPVERSASGDRLPSVTNLGLTWGVLPLRNLNLELGADHKSGYGALDSYPIYGNAKLGVPERAFSRFLPALAVGILDVGLKRGVTDYNVVYGKAARTLGVLGRVSAGYFRGNRKLLLDGSGGKDNAGVIAAWERTIPEISDRLWLSVDYMGTKSAYGTLNVGGSWKFTDRMVVLAGYDIYNDSRVSPNTITIQADVDFDLGSGK